MMLWADTLCIDQNNLVEKSAQVQLMARIYECASEVLVWLGDEIPGTTTALAMDFLHRRQISFRPTARSRPQILLQEDLQDPRFQAQWTAIGQDLLNRRWFQRVWTIQEIACASRAIVICGQHRIPWEKLVFAETFARSHDIRILFKTQEEQQARGDCFFTNIDRRALYRSNRACQSPRPMILSELLMNNVRCSSKDPRDMIYSLLGLATDVQDAPELQSDYSKPVPQVYTDLIRFCIRVYQSLDILSMSRHPKAHKELPSWIPDFTNAAQHISTLLPPLTADAHENGRYVYRASGDSKPNPADISKDGQTLHLQAIFVDTISEVGSHCLEGGDEGFSAALVSWVHLVSSRWRDWKQRPYLPGGGGGGGDTIEDALNRTITADRTRFGHRAQRGQRGFDIDSSAMPPDYRNGQGLDSREVKEKWWEDDAIRAVDLVATRRRFFITRDGYLGLGPGDIELGDEVDVVVGCSVPLILRKMAGSDNSSSSSNNNSDEHDSSYFFVGESFVTGIMDGEVMEEVRQKGTGTDRLRDVFLR